MNIIFWLIFSVGAAVIIIGLLAIVCDLIDASLCHKPRRIIPGWLALWCGVVGNGNVLRPNEKFWGVSIRQFLIGVIRVNSDEQ